MLFQKLFGFLFPAPITTVEPNPWLINIQFHTKMEVSKEALFDDFLELAYDVFLPDINSAQEHAWYLEACILVHKIRFNSRLEIKELIDGRFNKLNHCPSAQFSELAVDKLESVFRQDYYPKLYSNAEDNFNYMRKR